MLPADFLPGNILAASREVLYAALARAQLDLEPTHDVPLCVGLVLAFSSLPRRCPYCGVLSSTYRHEQRDIATLFQRVAVLQTPSFGRSDYRTPAIADAN
jgi:hypothetical protein